ncbi:Zinc finger protein 704 [Eumeta japonica]|uniref:Zinc finger protein 704 n=1 Tax=Eumeta variegata TaxID=151549 RepID=A0A4C1UY68_EUMVA|nr:Zinc finger protein 704 [Eumeta japonica]
MFECTWRGCGFTTNTCASIEGHIRSLHLGTTQRHPELWVSLRLEGRPWADPEVAHGFDTRLPATGGGPRWQGRPAPRRPPPAPRRSLTPKKEGESDHEEEFYYTERELTAPPPTLSHRDMCRPPHEDPDYQRQLVGSFRQGLLSTMQQHGSARPISIPGVLHHSWSSSQSPKHMRLSGAGGSPGSPGRRPRSDNKKCRKVYGMEHRELWCTQCKWKKACSRTPLTCRRPTRAASRARGGSTVRADVYLVARLSVAILKAAVRSPGRRPPPAARDEEASVFTSVGLA